MTTPRVVALVALEALCLVGGAAMMIRAIRHGLLRKRITRYGQVLDGRQAVRAGVALLIGSIVGLVGGVGIAWSWLSGKIVW